MWAQGLMDDWTNNLKLANDKLGTLVLALDTSILELEKLDETKGFRIVKGGGRVAKEGGLP